MANGAGFWMGVHQILLGVSIAPSYIKFGHNGGIQHPLLKIIKKDFFFKRYTQLDLKVKFLTQKGNAKGTKVNQLIN